MADFFCTIRHSSEGLFKDKGSKFLAFAFPVDGVEQAMEIVKQKRRDFFDARHVCFAYTIGADRELFRCIDDGEPSGTAGKPILGQINSNCLTNILVVVVRYFGGTLLGTSGLINAYKTAAAEAIKMSEVIEVDIEKEIRVDCQYQFVGSLMRIVKEFELKIVRQKQELECEFILQCKQKHFENLVAKLKLNHNFRIGQK